MTELYDYLRLLFARIGKTISPISGREVKKDDVTDVVKFLQGLNNGQKILILVPFKIQANRDVKEELNILLQKGFSRIYHNKEIIRIEDVLENSKHPIYKQKEAGKSFLLIDRLIKKDFDEDDIHRIQLLIELQDIHEAYFHVLVNGRDADIHQ
jgi:excinuclease ABC subunit A